MKFGDLKKFIKNPKLFLVELKDVRGYQGNHLSENVAQRPEVEAHASSKSISCTGKVFCFGFNHRRISFVKKFFPVMDFVFVSTQAKAGDLIKVKNDLLSQKNTTSVWVWGTKVPDIVKPLLKNKDINCFYFADGFFVRIVVM